MTTIDQPRFTGPNGNQRYLEHLVDSARFAVQQAEQEGAALRGEFGPERQLRAMSALYKALKAEGRAEEAAAVKAAGLKILQASKG